MRFVMTMVALVMAAAPAWAQGQTTPPPAPGSPAIFKSAADLAAVLEKATANAAGMFSSNVTTNDQYRVSLIKRDQAAGALAHAGNTELLYIVDGEGTMVTGGKLIAAANGKPASVVDGVSKAFVKGDVFIVPPGSPHWFAEITKPVTYLEVRWVAPK
jgi:glc operon protein GlcG